MRLPIPQGVGILFFLFDYVLYNLYQPRKQADAPVYLIEPSKQAVSQAIQHLKQLNHQVALLAPQSFERLQADYYFSLGAAQEIEQMSAALYDALRACDKTDATVILATARTRKGVGTAIMNRLEKAAGGKWFKKNEF